MPPKDEDENGLLDAISTAVEEARPADARAADEEVDDEEEPDPNDDKGGADTDDDVDDPDKTGEAGDYTDPAALKDGKKPGEQKDKKDPAAADQGKGKKPDADAKPPAKPKAGAKTPDAKPGKKAPDHVNDPLPEGLKKETAERMSGLIATVKNVTKERDDFKTENEELFGLIQDTGADPQTFGRHMEVLRLMNSSNVEEQRSAVAVLRKAADKLAADLGEEIPGKDPLEGHQDLIDEVEEGDLKRERAIEIAKGRNRAAANEKRTGAAATAEQRDTEFKAAVETARADLNTLGASLKKLDPAMYAAKTAALLPAVQRMVKSTPPSEWAGAYKDMYEALKLPGGPRVGDGKQRVKAGTGERQPLRPKQGAGGNAVQAPKTIEEAVEFGISQAGRR